MSNGNGTATKTSLPKAPTMSQILKSDRIGPSDRTAFTRLINSRRDTILRAMTDEMFANPEQMNEQLRAQSGLVFTPSQIEEHIREITDQIKQEIEKHVGPERAKINVKKADHEEEYDKKEKEMKTRHRNEFDQLYEERKNLKKTLSESLVTIEQKIEEEHCVELHAKKKQYLSDLAIARRLTSEIEAKSRQRLSLIKTNKTRIENLIRDCTNRSQEELWMIETRIEANELLTKIPTVEQIMALCQSPEGVAEFIRMLSPNLALPAPATSPSDITHLTPTDEELKIVEGEHTIIRDVDDGDGEESASELHHRHRRHDREVYETQH